MIYDLEAGVLLLAGLAVAGALIARRNQMRAAGSLASSAALASATGLLLCGRYVWAEHELTDQFIGIGAGMIMMGLGLRALALGWAAGPPSAR